MRTDHSTTVSGWRAKLQTLLQSPRLVPVSIILVICLCVPSLATSLFGDDHYHRARLLAPELMPAKTDLSIFGLFTISNGTEANLDQLVSKGLIPWFVQPEFRFQPWRPLAELAHAVDYRVWPDQFWLMHLHQIAWIVLFFFAVKAWNRHLFSASPAVAALATALVVLDANMAQTHYWLAGRNTLMAATFSVLTLLFYSRHARSGGLKNVLLSLCCFSLGLLSSELTLSVTGFLFAYAWFLQKGGISRFIRLLPFVLISLTWMLAYTFGRQGVAGSEWYFEPITEPLAFLQAILFRLPKALFQQFFILPLEIFGRVNVGSIAWVLGILIVGYIVYLLRPFMRTQEHRFLVLGSLLSLLPLCAGPGIPRVLLLVSVGLMPVMANFLLAYASAARNSASRSILFWLFISLHGVGLVCIPVIGFVFAYSDKINVQEPARTLDVAQSDLQKQWVTLNSASPMQAMMFPLVRAGEKLGLPQNWYLTGAGTGEIEVISATLHSIELSSETAFLASPADYFVRKKSMPFSVDQRRSFSGMTVTVLRLTLDQRPHTVRFEFARALDEQDTLLFVCQGNKLVRMTLAQLQQVSKLKCGS